jgi:hypothetical protein
VDPHPEKPIFVQPKVEKLVRRGPRDYVIIGKKSDRSPVEIRLSAVSSRWKASSVRCAARGAITGRRDAERVVVAARDVVV